MSAAIDEKQIEELAQRCGIDREQAREYLGKYEVVDLEEEQHLRGIFGSVNGPVLELGAGGGEFTRELLEKHLKPDQKLYAVERLKTAAQVLKDSVADARLEVLCSDSTALPLPDGAVSLVVSRAALHDFVSDDGDVAKALRDCVRVLAPGGVFLVYDKIRDGFNEVERESAEGRMERMNVELAALEGKRCWGLHLLADYVALLEQLSLKDVEHHVLGPPDMPGYQTMMRNAINERRAAYVKRWGEGVNPILDSLYADFERTPNRALQLALVWGRKPTQ